MGYLNEACDEKSDFCHQFLLRKMRRNMSIYSMCIKINKVGKQEVEIWRVQKRYPQYGIHIFSSWPNIRFLPSIVAEKNVTKNILDWRTEVKQYTPLPSGEWGYNNCNLLIKGQSGEGNNKAYTYTYIYYIHCFYFYRVILQIVMLL